MGIRGAGHSSSGARLHLLLRAQHTCFALRRGERLVPPLLEGLLVEAVAGNLFLAGVDFPRFDILGGPLKHRGRLT